MHTCSKCKRRIDECDAYEYRGAIACDACFDEVIAARDQERNAIIAEEQQKLSRINGFDISRSTAIGKANRELLRGKIHDASTESARLRSYERGC